jgi:hypothetical protein
MKKNFLFAIDEQKKEVIISESLKGSNKIEFIERIGQKENDIFYNAVLTLTAITKNPNFDAAIFKAMDKACQLIYSKLKEGA